jgi:TM2 domain-containing membrane protein YozV
MADEAEEKPDEPEKSLSDDEPFADMPIDAAVEAAVDAAAAAAAQSHESNFDATDLRPCPECETLLKPWQISCHNCGRRCAENIEAPVPALNEETHQTEELAHSYQSWLDKGKADLESENYGEAQTCFLEALARTKALPNQLLSEIEARKGLAKALEKLEKKGEATEQYMLLSQLNKDAAAGQADEFAKRARQLSLSTMDILSSVDRNASFRPPVASEFRLAPLYCGQCKRILLESEVYHVRKGLSLKVRCFCGAEGVPLVRSDAKHLRALKTASSVRKRKSLLIQAASDHLPEGRQKQIAVILAVVLGGFGAHKFYLGEKVPGLIYLATCWTLVPIVIGWFEALNYSQMSRVTFNLMYNIELVLRRLPAEEVDELSPDHAEVFSMEIAEVEPEDFVDQFSRESEK